MLWLSRTLKAPTVTPKTSSLILQEINQVLGEQLENQLACIPRDLWIQTLAQIPR